MTENKTRISFYLRDYTVRVFTSALRALDKPKYVRFLINPDTLKMALSIVRKSSLHSGYQGRYSRIQRIKVFGFTARNSVY